MAQGFDRIHLRGAVGRVEAEDDADDARELIEAYRAERSAPRLVPWPDDLTPLEQRLGFLAPAFLAGVPVITKPATATAYVAEAVVRLIIDSGLLPAGALQLICGSTGDLLDHPDALDRGPDGGPKP